MSILSDLQFIGVATAGLVGRSCLHGSGSARTARVDCEVGFSSGRLIATTSYNCSAEMSCGQ